MRTFVVDTRYGKCIIKADNEEAIKREFKNEPIRIDNMEDFEEFD